jgi:hypothetical protein
MTRAPDVIGPLVGWRAWYVKETDEGWRLSSIHYSEPWPAGRQLEAECHRSRYVATANESTHARHEAPGKRCLCGVYAAKEVEQAKQYFVASYAGPEGVPPGPDYVHRAVGQVSLWGRVLDCTLGYRASIAYPARLWIPTRRPDGEHIDVEAVALGLLDYGVPVDLIGGGAQRAILRELQAIERSLA